VRVDVLPGWKGNLSGNGYLGGSHHLEQSTRSIWMIDLTHGTPHRVGLLAIPLGIQAEVEWWTEMSSQEPESRHGHQTCHFIGTLFQYRDNGSPGLHAQWSEQHCLAIIERLLSAVPTAEEMKSGITGIQRAVTAVPSDPSWQETGSPLCTQGEVALV